MPEQDGPFKIQTCPVCHIHGNRDRSHCDKEPCSSWTSCGRKESHKHEVARAKKDIRKIFTIISLGFLNIPRTGKLEFLRVCCSTGRLVPMEYFTFIFINGHDFQSGIKSVCDECKNNVFFSLPRKL
jgi:hypothetical protein